MDKPDFSPEFRAYAEALLPGCPELPNLTPEERLCLAFCYGTLPAQDRCLPPEVLLGYVRHALYLRQESPYAKALPEEIFLQFVLYPRVNSENLTDCRRFFYERLKNRVMGLTEEQAALQVNIWCAEHMTYMASDDRTESPVTAYRCGYGRCGEESVFAVTALRSVGLAARQIYVPLWSHCDDNHAWVEVFVGGKWQYLGACEPEPVLNRGWFTPAASRAELACYRTFSDYGIRDAQVDTQGCCKLYNVIDHYAPSREIRISVKNPRGGGVPGAVVTISLPNMGALLPIARVQGDAGGCCRLRLGKGGAFAESRVGELSGSLLLSEGEETEFTLTLGQEAPENFDCVSPPASLRPAGALTGEQERENALVLASCARHRAERRVQPSKSIPQCWRERLQDAGENALELGLLSNTPEAEDYFRMLRTLRPKDLRDTPPELLRQHYDDARIFRGAPHFWQEILCPRIGNELLTFWRQELRELMGEECREFAEQPEQLAQFLDARFPENDAAIYPPAERSPREILRSGFASYSEKQTLCTAALRTLGIPARLSPVDGRAEYYRDGAYRPAWNVRDPAYVTIQTALAQNVQYTLSPVGGKPLSLPEGEEITLPAGSYRLLTANRLPNGTQRCRLETVTLKAGEHRVITPILRTARPEEMLGNATLPPVAARTLAGNALSPGDVVKGMSLLVFLDVGKEPTEHILNELAEAGKRLEDTDCCFFLANAEEKNDPTLCRTLSALPRASVLLGRGEAEARSAFLEPGVYPLLLVTDETGRCYYGCCGYQVGNADLALRLKECAKDLRCKNSG